MTHSLTTWLAHNGIALFVMLCCFVGSACGIVNEILHSPDMPNYRASPPWVRLAMALFAISLAGRGAEIAFDWYYGQLESLDISAVPASLCMAIVQAAYVWDTLRQRLPVRTQRRINRLLHLASCGRRGAALIDLTLMGATVVAPGERSAPRRLID